MSNSKPILDVLVMIADDGKKASLAVGAKGPFTQLLVDADHVYLVDDRGARYELESARRNQIEVAMGADKVTVKVMPEADDEEGPEYSVTVRDLAAESELPNGPGLSR